ncbi:MAG: alpha-amylase [Butyrivibrio sp.]|nr:alpha-amylase [Butyrivibrio sp.]
MKNSIKRITAILLMTLMIAATGCGSVKEEEGVSRPPKWTQDAVMYEVNVRQYTPSGTFNEFSEHLDTLKDMGVNTLWFMPIHPISVTNRSGKLGSYYSVTDYREVNPEFGTKEDFKALVDKAHDMGFKVVLDWVANHTGWDCPWISEHPDWYTQENGQIISPKNMGWPDVADLNYDNADMRKEMIECMKYWIREYDIDGFRCDYAPGVPVDFWEEARKELDKVKDVYMLEEDLGAIAGANLNYAFDSNYSGKLYEALVEVAKDNKKADKIKLYLQGNDNHTFGMNYLDNHDVNSYDRTVPQAFDSSSYPAMLSLIFTIPGIPMIYSSDEIAYDHAIAFMEKDTINWEKGTGNYRGLIRDLAGIRKDHKALYAGNENGTFEILDTGNKNIFAFERTEGKDTVICIFNLSKRQQEEYDLSGILTGEEKILYSGTDGQYGEGGDNPNSLDNLNPWSFYLLTR